MSGQNVKEEVYKLCERLDSVTDTLYNIRRRIKFYVLTIGVYIFASAFLLYYIYYLQTGYSISEVVFIIGCILVICAFILYLVCFMMTLNKYILIKRKGEQVLSDILEIVDWQEFRKRQLYKGPDKEIVLSIKQFYYEVHSVLSPVKNNSCAIKWIRFVFIISILGLCLQSAYYVFQVFFV